MKKKLVFFAALLLSVTLMFASCREPGDNGDDAQNGAQAAEGGVLAALAALDALGERFPSHFNTGEAHVPGTTLYFGIASDSPWVGMIGGAVFHDAAIDATIAEPLGTASSVFSTNENLQFGQDGIATWEMDLDAMTFTINMSHYVYWHDGVPLTLDDLVFAYEVIAHPDYTGVRFSAEIRMVSGIMDFHNGYADSISGLVLSNNNRTLTMHFDEMSPGMLYFGLWTAPTPRHVFEGIPVADMAASEWVRTTPVGWGPFMIEHVVPGESVSMVRNPDYVFGMPVLERLEIQRIASPLIAESMHSGMFDIIGFPTAEFGDHMDPENFFYVGTVTGDYSFIAFRLGHWDFEYGVNTYSPHRKMSQAGALFRQAMAYAIDPGFIGETVFNGLQIAAATNVTPNHRALQNPEIRGFPYDPERARELLDQAGFDQFDDEGFRLDPNGERFTVVWAFPENPLVQDQIIPFYIGQWAAVGIRVELWRGSVHSIFTLWDYLDDDLDNDEIDIYNAGWSVGANPNPEGAWGHIFWNPSRYTSPEYDAILDRMSTMAAFDFDYKRQVFFDWQDYWQENVPYFPLLWGISLTAVNNRVTNWDTRFWNLGTNPNDRWHQVGLSRDVPYGR